MGFDTKVDIYNFEEYQRNNRYMGYNHIEIEKVAKDNCIVKVNICDDSKNIYGYVHGGLMYSMADCVAGLTARTDGNSYVTQSSHVNFLRNTDGGTIYSEGKVVKRGRTMTIVHISVYDESGRQLLDGVIDMIRTER